MLMMTHHRKWSYTYSSTGINTSCTYFWVRPTVPVISIPSVITRERKVLKCFACVHVPFFAVKIPTEILFWTKENRKRFVDSMTAGKISVYSGRGMVTFQVVYLNIYYNIVTTKCSLYTYIHHKLALTPMDWYIFKTNFFQNIVCLLPIIITSLNFNKYQFTFRAIYLGLILFFL